MIHLKSDLEIELMQRGGEITSAVLQTLIRAVKVDTKLIDLDSLAEEEILKLGAEPSFKTVDNYPYTTCINVNEGIVHGMPNEYKLKKSDIVSIDIGSLYKGFHTDLSYTLEVETDYESTFLKTGKLALEKAISSCKLGNRIGDISASMQQEVESKGYSVSEMLVGHGVGRKLHEDPYVPCYGVFGTGHKLKAGMVLAIEVIYQKGRPDLVESSDGWTLKTADGSLSALYEKTVALTRAGTVVITEF